LEGATEAVAAQEGVDLTAAVIWPRADTRN
jgi:hypothetical protein